MNNPQQFTVSLFRRYQPQQCPTCKFYQHHDTWFGVCNGTNQYLTNPKNGHPKRNSCREYKPIEVEMNELTQSEYLERAKILFAELEEMEILNNDD